MCTRSNKQLNRWCIGAAICTPTLVFLVLWFLFYVAWFVFVIVAPVSSPSGEGHLFNLSTDPVESIQLWAGSWWIGGRAGLFQLDPTSTSQELAPICEDGELGSVIQLLPQANQLLIVAGRQTGKDSLFVLSRRTDGHGEISSDREQPWACQGISTDHAVVKVLKDLEFLWVATEAGLYRYRVGELQEIDKSNPIIEGDGAVTDAAFFGDRVALASEGGITLVDRATGEPLMAPFPVPIGREQRVKNLASFNSSLFFSIATPGQGGGLVEGVYSCAVDNARPICRDLLKGHRHSQVRFIKPEPEGVWAGVDNNLLFLKSSGERVLVKCECDPHDQGEYYNSLSRLGDDYWLLGSKKIYLARQRGLKNGPTESRDQWSFQEIPPLDRRNERYSVVRDRSNKEECRDANRPGLSSVDLNRINTRLVVPLQGGEGVLIGGLHGLFKFSPTSRISVAPPWPFPLGESLDLDITIQGGKAGSKPCYFSIVSRDINRFEDDYKDDEFREASAGHVMSSGWGFINVAVRDQWGNMWLRTHFTPYVYHRYLLVFWGVIVFILGLPVLSLLVKLIRGVGR